MKKFFVQETMKIVEMKPIKEVTFKIDVPSTYGFNYLTAVDKEINEFFDSIGDYKKPILFKVVGEFDLLEEADVDDKVSFILGIVSIFTGNMIKKGTSTGKGRFAAPSSLDELNITTMVKRDLVNREVRFPIFSMEVLDEKGNLVYEVM